jgi:predicted HicB family RNase H-like nuclease
VRLTPEMHRRIASKAAEDGKSLNTWVAEVLHHAVEPNPANHFGRS